MEQLVAVPHWDDAERLAEEKKALGFYLSGHPYSAYANELKTLVRCPLASLAPQATPIYLAGVVGAVRILQTRRGRMCFVTLDDGSAQTEVAVFGELFETRRELFKDDAVLIVLGKAAHDDYTGGMRVSAEQVYDLASVRARFARRIELRITDANPVDDLGALLSPYRGGECEVEIDYRNGIAGCRIAAGRVACDDALVRKLRSAFADAFSIVYQAPAASPAPAEMAWG